MRLRFLITTGLVVVMAMLLAMPGMAAPPDTAEVHFGDENVGSPFGPEEGHDRSFHAVDKMVPRTVVISAGGNVTFDVSPFHQVAIYEPGTKPGDIDLSPENLDDLALPTPPFPSGASIPDFIINDPVGRVALSPPLDFATHFDWTFTFDEPGRYLVICTTLPHFEEADMYGWVIVK